MYTCKIQIPEKLEPVLSTSARIVVLIGGRGSAKTESLGRIMWMKAQTERADILCGRQYQTSIDDSVHKLLCKLIHELGIEGAVVTDKKIDLAGGGGFRYKGFARDPQAVKSAQDFKYCWVNEAQDLSDPAIRDLLPTIRAGNSKLFFEANPQASNDPFSKRFINPFKNELDRNGIYEDEMHLIIKINWRDNPWFPKELQLQRVWDYDNLSRAEYDHIWEGAFNDQVENSIIKPEWFDAAIDAHKVLGFEPRGIKVVVHDPSDTGADNKGLIYRHGNVILEAEEKIIGDVNDGCDWAIDKALEVVADLFVWDGDGMGLGLKRQIMDAFDGKRITVKMFRGSEGPDQADAIYDPDERLEKGQRRSNRQTFLNKRAQFYMRLRDRFYSTWRAVVKKEYIDPDNLISISSRIECLDQYRSEVCRIPRKANGRGLIQIMSKDEMVSKLKIASPNLSDSTMMSLENNDPLIKPVENQTYHIPDLQRF